MPITLCSYLLVKRKHSSAQEKQVDRIQLCNDVWKVYWIGHHFPVEVPYETIAHFVDEVKLCRERPGKTQRVAGCQMISVDLSVFSCASKPAKSACPLGFDVRGAE